MANSTDPYGVDIALTDTGDVVVTPAGQLGTIGGPDNCVQALKGRVRTIVGELPLHPEYGSAFPTRKFVGRKLLDTAPIQAEAVRELRLLVAQDARFIAAQDVQAVLDPLEATAVQVKATLALVGGTVVRLSDVATPTVEEISDQTVSDVADLASDNSTDGFNDFDFIADSETELADLADAADLTNIVALGG